MVFIGDSLTAGTQDATTRAERQVNAWPAQLARHAALPYLGAEINNEGIPFSPWHNGTFDVDHFRAHLDQVRKAVAPLAIYAYYVGAPPWIPPIWQLADGMGRRTEESMASPARPQTNFAVPGFEMRHLTAIGSAQDYLRDIHEGLSGMNDIAQQVPLVRAILGNGECSGHGSEVQQALQQNPDVVIVWGGNNDALATVFGGTLDDRTLTPVEDRLWRVPLYNPVTNSWSQAVTDRVVVGFRNQVLGPGGLVDQLLDGSQAEIFLLNIPDVTVIPLLREVGKPLGKLPFRVVLQNGQDVTAILERWPIPDTVRGDGLNGRTQFPAGTRVSISTLLWRIVADGAPADANELTARLSALSTGYFAEWEVLDPDEIQMVQQRIHDFNAILQEACQRSPRIHLVDIHGELNRCRIGRRLRGDGPDQWVVPGFTGAVDPYGRDGIFSYDGVHPSDTGHAVVANMVLDRLRTDLGHLDKFKRFRNIPSLDEKAVHRRDPHKTQPASIVLDPAVIQQWRAGQYL